MSHPPRNATWPMLGSMLCASRAPAFADRNGPPAAGRTNARIPQWLLEELP
jgi:hypothetical protein